MNITKTTFLATALLALGASAAEVAHTDAPVTADGRLDEPVWQKAVWADDFVRPQFTAHYGPVDKRTAFALATDGRTLYVAVKCYDPELEKTLAQPDRSLWVTDSIEVFLSPDGTPDNFYHFAVGPTSKDIGVEFRAEGGNISPDPYAPAGQHAVGRFEAGWTAEFAIPLSAFYMTRNAAWTTTWRLNVARHTTGNNLSTWSPLEENFLEPARFRTLAGFPQRQDADDIGVLSAVAEMTGEADGKVVGQLALTVVAGVAGEYDVTISAGGTTRVTLAAGENKVSVPCAYPSNGRDKTHIAVRHVATGAVGERDYPVLVDFQPVRVTFTTPQYRNNFYPGQKTDRIAGRVVVAGGKRATLRLTGPGFPERTAEVDGSGEFSFDTTGFEKGDAWLEVRAGDITRRCRVRNLPPTGRKMVWIEDGNLVVDGKPTLRRNIYALGFKVGRRFSERFAKDRASFRMTDVGRQIGAELGRLIPGIERKEGIRDVEPCEALKKKLRAIHEANRDRDCGMWYVCDEPECRGVSPVYLKNVREFLAELDPYHPVLTASRGGKAYIDTADWFETHPYLSCGWDENGKRRYGTHPRDMGRFIEAYEAEDRPDKVIGFLPTCFSYRWTTPRNDYPTFDEYLAHTWGAFIAGAKTLWPYAGHDLGDRAALYEGCRYTFQQAEAYEPFILLGKRKVYPRKDDVDRATWELNGDILDVTVDYKTMKTTIRAPAKYEKGLEPMADVAARIAKAEAERKGRDNQLRGRYEDVKVTDNMLKNFGGGNYKLIDGTLDMLARESKGLTNAWIALEMKFRPTFDRVLVHGYGVQTLEVEVGDASGAWRKVAVKDRRSEEWLTEVTLVETVTSDRVRLSFPGPANRPNEREVYEVELPFPKDSSASSSASSRKDGYIPLLAFPLSP